MIPIKIAVSRGIKGQSLTTIKVLSWLGLFVGITWFIALIMSLVCEEKANYSSISNLTDLEMLEKLAKLKDVGVITNEEFSKKKQEILGIKNEIKTKDINPLYVQNEDLLSVMKKEKLSFEDFEQLAILLEKGLITQKEYNDKRDEFYGSKK